MMVLKVEQLERLLEYVAAFYSDIEKGRAGANRKKYEEHYLSVKKDLEDFIGEYDS